VNARALSRGPLAATLALVVLAAALSELLAAAGAPTPTLFGPLLAAAALALRGAPASPPPAALVTGSQAVIGVTVGAYVNVSTLATVASNWLPVAGVCFTTLVMSVLAGLLLGRRSDIDRATASFCMIAGGASGLTAISRQLGADERLVAVVQYLRVLLVVVITPLAARILFAAGDRPAEGRGAHVTYGSGASLAFLLGCAAAGLILVRLVRLPAGSLLGPMLISAGVTLAGVGYGGTLRALAQDLAFAVIGAQIGLRFSRSSLRVAGRILPAAAVLIVVVMAGCAALGALLASVTGTTALDGYLATTPGGLYVVLATSTSSHADTTFVVSVQVLRLVMMLLLAPLLARVLGAKADVEGLANET
jgi:membrane AbrB-like protein